MDQHLNQNPSRPFDPERRKRQIAERKARRERRKKILVSKKRKAAIMKVAEERRQFRIDFERQELQDSFLLWLDALDKDALKTIIPNTQCNRGVETIVHDHEIQTLIEFYKTKIWPEELKALDEKIQAESRKIYKRMLVDEEFRNSMKRDVNPYESIKLA